MRELTCAHSQRHRLTGVHARGFYVDLQSHVILTVANSVNEEVHTVRLASISGLMAVPGTADTSVEA